MQSTTHFRPKISTTGSGGLKRIPAVQARLDRWAEWRGGAVSLGGGGSPIGYLMDLAAGKRVSGDDGCHGSMVPVDSIECSVTEDAVMMLPDDLRQAVIAWHCATSGTLDEVAARMGVVKTTLWRRLAHADHRIHAWLRDRRRAVL